MDTKDKLLEAFEQFRPHINGHETAIKLFLEGIKEVEELQDMKVFKALYNPMIEESGYCTISVHRSKGGAESAISKHREKRLEEWKRDYPTKKDEPFNFGKFEEWDVSEITLLP